MIWFGLEHLRKAVHKVLNCKMKKLGSYQSASSIAYIASETWEYLNHCLKDIANKPSKCTLKQVCCEMMASITLQSFWDEENLDCIQLETNDELQGLCNILGEATTVGVKKARPPVEESRNRMTLIDGDILNVVLGSQSKEEPYRHRTTWTGVDFRFNGRDEMHFTIWYIKDVYDPDKKGIPKDSFAKV